MQGRTRRPANRATCGVRFVESFLAFVAGSGFREEGLGFREGGFGLSECCGGRQTLCSGFGFQGAEKEVFLNSVGLLLSLSAHAADWVATH